MKQLSQTEKILQFLLKGGSLTPMQALKKFQCWALSSRISEIRAMNKYNVKSELISVNKGEKFVSKYSISI